MADREPILPDDLVEEIQDVSSEDSILTEYFTNPEAGDTEKLSHVDAFTPGADEWKGKTNIAAHQARLLALGRILCRAFPEVKEYEPLLEDAMTNYEMYLTSIDGMSRTEITSILKALFGGSGDPEEEASRWVQAFSAMGREDER